MTVENHFNWEWKELADKSCLYVTVSEVVDDQHWIAFFEEIMETYQDVEAFIIIDIRHVEDRISLEGLQGVIDILKRQGVKSAVFAALTTHEYHDLTASMFQCLAGMSDFKLQVDVFFNEDSARRWMIERIGCD